MSLKPAGNTVSRKRPEREATRQRLDHLLTATAALYAEKGYEATSMRDVSGAVGGSLAGLYHYCTGKEDLLYQLQYRTFATLLEVQTERARMAGHGGGTVPTAGDRSSGVLRQPSRTN